MTNNSVQTDDHLSGGDELAIGKTAANRHRNRGRLRELTYRYALVLAWAVVIVVFGFIRPDTFLSAANFQTIFGSQAVLLIATLGLLFPLAAGEFDLSIGGILGFTTAVVAVLNVNSHWPIVYAVLLALVLGLVIGIVNAFFTVVVGIHSFVV